MASKFTFCPEIV